MSTIRKLPIFWEHIGYSILYFQGGCRKYRKQKQEKKRKLALCRYHSWQKQYLPGLPLFGCASKEQEATKTEAKQKNQEIYQESRKT